VGDLPRCRRAVRCGGYASDHDNIATFRRQNSEAISEAFAQVLLMGRELGLLKVGMVSIDVMKIDADASKIHSVRYDRAKVLREKLDRDIAALLARAEAADGEEVPDPQALPREISRREARRAKLDAACQHLEAETRAKAEAGPAAHEDKLREHGARNGQGRPPKPPDDPVAERAKQPDRPDAKHMRKSKRHEYRQA